MRKGTIRTFLDLFPLHLYILVIPRTILYMIKRTITEQTIKLLQISMAGKIFTFSVFEITVRIFHNNPSFLSRPTNFGLKAQIPLGPNTVYLFKPFLALRIAMILFISLYTIIYPSSTPMPGLASI